MTAKLKCLIVGAGSSGIAAAHEARTAGLDPIVYEARDGPGGAWRFDPDPGQCTVQFDDNGWATMSNRGESDFAGRPAPSPMYDALRTNVPTSIMQYRGTPFSPDVGLFCTHAQVQAYLENHAESLAPHVNYNRRVNRLRYTSPSDKGEQRRWYAEISSTTDPADSFREQFDFVMIANGHYSKPYIPWINGLKGWKGELTHARWYRNPGSFRNKTVLVVGNSASGYDITRELAMAIHDHKTSGEDSSRIPKLYQSARSPSALGINFEAPDAPEWAREITVLPPIRAIDGKSVTFLDGRVLEGVDTIIYATGYYFSFPFLRPTDSPWAEHPVTRPPSTPEEPSTFDTDLGHCVGPSSGSTAPVEGGLRLHNLDDRFLFYLPDPTAAFLCLPYLVIPFPLAQIQARLASLHFTNSSQLPRPLSFVPGTGTAARDEEPEMPRSSIVWGHPKQFDIMDRMVIESGDYSPESTDQDERDDDDAEGTGTRTTRTTTTTTTTRSAESEAVSPARYGKTSQADRDLRVGAKALRRAVLGY